MPYVLRHAETGELLATPQVNGYGLPYFGVVLWDEEPDGEARAQALLAAGTAGEAAAGPPPPPDVLEAAVARWLPHEVSEREAKLANVKLRNDPRRRVYWRDGGLAAE